MSKPGYHTYHAHIKGVYHRGADIQAYCQGLDYPAEVLLEREPDNAFDKNAIKVYHDDIWIGYIAKEVASWLAPKMDDGMEYIAEATGLETGDRTGKRATWLMLQVHVKKADRGQETGPEPSAA